MKTPKFIDISGMKFGRLTVVSRAENSKSNQTQWLCKCECGNYAIVRSASLINGHTKSCGCYSNEIRKINCDQTKHNLSKTRLYGIWSKMKDRCYNPKVRIYKYYGGKGVTICEEWKNSPEAFCDWAYKNGYSEKLSIDRIDVNGDYEPSNCRWVDKVVQMNNTSANVYYDYNGKRMTLTQIAREVNIPYSVLALRVNSLKYSLDDAVKYPVGELPKKETKWRYITWNGKTKTIAGWAKELKINKCTLYRRINAWGDIDRAFTEPLQKSV